MKEINHLYPWYLIQYLINDKSVEVLMKIFHSSSMYDAILFELFEYQWFYIGGIIYDVWVIISISLFVFLCNICLSMYA